MKKLLSFLTAGVLCGSLLAALPVSAAETATRKVGDVSGDGVSDSDDGVFIVLYYIACMKGTEAELVATWKKNDPNIEISPEIADINNDGSIDQFDAVAIQYYYAYSIINEDNADYIPTIDAYYEVHGVPKAYPLGDVTGDGKVDLNDSTALQKYYALSLIYDDPDDITGCIKTTFGYKATRYSFYHNVADINKDKQVDMDDVILIQKYYALSILGEAPDSITDLCK